MARHPDPETAILDAAQRLLELEGAPPFTMDQLALEAGVSRATLYRRFATREAILQRLAETRGMVTAGLEQADVRTRILDATRRLFARASLSGTTIEQIAQEAGVGPATIYRHFGSREKLWQAFGREHTPRNAARALALNPTENLEEDLTSLVTRALIFIDKNRDLIRVGLRGGMELLPDLQLLRDGPDRTLDNLTRYFEAQIQAGRMVGPSPQMLALTLAGMVFAHSLLGPAIHGTQLEHPERTAAFIVGLFLDGVRSRRAVPIVADAVRAPGPAASPAACAPVSTVADAHSAPGPAASQAAGAPGTRRRKKTGPT